MGVGVEISDGLGDLDDFEITSGGEVETVGGGVEEFLGGGSEVNKFCDLG